MTQAGIVRRIDELGRIVIPKEIRRTLRIREGDPLEIFTNHEGGVILKKYSPIGELGVLAKEYVESVANVAKCTVCVADRDQIVAAAGPDKKSYSGKGIHRELKQCIDDRANILSTEAKGTRCKVVEDGDSEENEAIGSIVSEGDAIGAVILLSRDKKKPFGEFEEKMALCGANFLGRQMES